MPNATTVERAPGEEQEREPEGDDEGIPVGRHGAQRYASSDALANARADALSRAPATLQLHRMVTAPAEPPSLANASRAVVLFDGVCNLCNGYVRFVVKRDRRGRVHFAPLQSAAAAELLRGSGVDPQALDSIVLVDGAGVHRRSDAVLRVARLLDGAWPLLAALRVLPRPLRDALYDVVARHRDRWFGRRDECMIPTPELRSRFLA